MIETTFEFFAGDNLEPVVHFNKVNAYISRFADLDVISISPSIITGDNYPDGVLSINTIPSFND